jgi:hypothetical protein
MRPELTRRRHTAALLMLAVACVLPVQSWAADCGVDGNLIRDAAMRGMNAHNDLINQSAADVMRSSKSRSNCLERFGVSQIPPLGFGGGGILQELANGAMEKACTQARGSVSRYLSDASSGLTSTFGGSVLPSLGSIDAGNLDSSINGAVNGAITNASNQIGSQIGSQLKVPSAVKQEVPSVWSRMTCYVSGNC